MDFFDEMKTFLTEHKKEVCFVAVIGVATAVLIKILKKKPTRQEFPRDVVVHHQIPRGPYAPSLTPFAIKLETYLRMMKVPHVNAFDSGTNMSSKGKLTWIEYNGEKVADSEFSIKFINKKFNIDMDKQFSEEEKAIAHSMQRMIEENTYWTLVTNRWVYGGGAEFLKFLKIPSFIMYFVVRDVRKMTKAQGIGRHSKAEVNEILSEDLQALSFFLGSKKFLLGDDPCKADCAVFGMLAEIYWHSFGDEVDAIFKKYRNLSEYCERMKTRFWPDWNDCIKQEADPKN